MKCDQVQKSLLFYLDEELASGDHQAISRHLAGCSACRQALASLGNTRLMVNQALQNLADEVEAPPLALSQLHARLAQEARPAPAASSLRFAHQAPGAERIPAHRAIGGFLMHKRILLPASLAVVIIAFLAFFLARNVTPVSAEQILDRASVSQTLNPSAQGIEHIRTQLTMNIQADPGDQAGTTEIVESYLDRQSGKLRLVTTNANGQVLDASGYDGAFTYSTQQPGDGSSPLVIYRSPQSNVSLATKIQPDEDPAQQAKQVFDQFRSSPDVKLTGKQTQSDGRVVYALGIAQQVKIMSNNQMEHTAGSTSMLFDASTFAMLEVRTTVQKDGKQVVVTDILYLANELLPANTTVTWDLSDLKGVSIVDDPNAVNGDLLPEIISPATLAANTSEGYLLKDIPDGFDLEITAPAKQAAGPAYVYVASYRSSTGDYFVVQTNTTALDMLPKIFGEEAYRTKSGLVLNFGKTLAGPDGKKVTQALVTTPDGTSFYITSTLPPERIKQLAEDLIAAKG